MNKEDAKKVIGVGETDPHRQRHEIHYSDGPLKGKTLYLTGVVPFAHFQIDGTMEAPVFHLYGFNLSQDGSQEPIKMSFIRTYNERQMDLILSGLPVTMGPPNHQLPPEQQHQG